MQHRLKPAITLLVFVGVKVNSLAIGAWQWGDVSFWGFDTYGGYGEDEIRQGCRLRATLLEQLARSCQ